MKKLLTRTFVGLLAVLGLSAIAAAPVQIYTYAVNGPWTNSVNYESFATNVVWDIYRNTTNGGPAGALGYRLNPIDITQPTDSSSNSLWFAVRVVSTSPEFMFTPSQIRFVGMSSDGGNALGKTNTFTDPNIVFTPQGMGVIWGSGGKRFNDTLLISANSWSTQVVHEIIFVGARSKFFTYSSPSEQNTIVATINSFPDFFVTGTWEFWQEGSRVAHASKTLRTKSVPAPGILSIADAPATQVTIGVSCGTNDSWNLQFKGNSLFTSWTDVATVNSGSTFTYPKWATSSGYWRLVLQ